MSNKQQKFFNVRMSDIQVMKDKSKACNFLALHLMSQIRNQYEYAKKTGRVKDGYMLVSYNDYDNIGISSYQAKRAVSYLVKVGLLEKYLYRENLKGDRGTFLGVKPVDTLDLLSSEDGTNKKEPTILDKSTDRSTKDDPYTQNRSNKVLKVQKEVNLSLTSSSNDATTTTEKEVAFSEDGKVKEAYDLIEKTFKSSAESLGKNLRKNFMNNFKEKIYPKILKDSLTKVKQYLEHYIENPTKNEKLNHPNPSVDSFNHWYYDIVRDFNKMINDGQYRNKFFTFDNWDGTESEEVAKLKRQKEKDMLSCSNWDVDDAPVKLENIFPQKSLSFI
jgi:hypothetical protein